MFCSVYTGVRMVVYEQLREQVFRRNEDGTIAVWKAMTCGILGGAIAQFLASPTDLVKVHLQMEGRRRLEGLPPRQVQLQPSRPPLSCRQRSRPSSILGCTVWHRLCAPSSPSGVSWLCGLVGFPTYSAPPLSTWPVSACVDLSRPSFHSTSCRHLH